MSVENTNHNGAQRPPAGKRVAPAGKKRLIVLCCIGAVLLAAAAAAVGWVYLYSGIYHGVEAGGIDLSGLSRKEAVAVLDEAFAGQSPGHSLEITVGEYTRTLELGGVDTRYDAKQTTENAYLYGRTGGFFSRVSDIWHAMTRGVELTPSISVDQALLDEEISQMAAGLSTQMSAPAYTLENDVLVLDRGQTGISIDEGDFKAFIRGRILSGDLSPVSYEPKTEDPDELDLLKIRDEIEQPVREPRLDLENDPSGNTVLPAQRGISLDVEAAQKVIEQSDERFVELPLEVTEPSMTTEQFESALFRDVLGEGTTSFNAGLVGRTTNVKLACDFVDGTILNPGDVFSYNDTVGPRTYERGFKDAIVYVGASAEDGVGGGICQVSSTIYYAMLRADLEVVERKAHSRIVTYVPLGEDATVAWGAVDFRFKNNTDYPIRIDVSYGRSSMTVKLVGTKTQNKTVQMETKVLSKTPFETVHVENSQLAPGTSKVKSNGYTGYVTETYRVVYIDGVQVSRTFENKSVYKKYDKVVEDGPALPVVNPDPGTTEPGTTDPGTNDPGTTDPGTADPGTNEPGTNDPGTTDPGTNDPGTNDPGTADSGTNEPGTTDPGTADPGTNEPGTNETGTTDPGTAEPVSVPET